MKKKLDEKLKKFPFRKVVNLDPYSSKKILLCERKRHTTRRVASIRTAVPAGGAG